MDKKRAVELLMLEVKRIPYLKNLPFDNDEFHLWLKNVENIINTGLEQEDKQKFQEASQFLRYISYEDDVRQRDYIDEIIRYEIALKSIIQRYEILGIVGGSDRRDNVEKVEVAGKIQTIKELEKLIKEFRSYKRLEEKSNLSKNQEGYKRSLQDILQRKIGTYGELVVSLTGRQYAQELNYKFDFWVEALRSGGLKSRTLLSVEYCIQSINEAIGKLNQMQLPLSDTHLSNEKESIISPKAFIAHGGKSAVLDKLLDFIQALGINPLVVELLPSKGMTVDDKVNKYIRDADCGIVLATKGGIVDTKSKKLKQHPRLNVIDELERLRAVFPEKTILLLERGVDLPSNISGLTHEPFAPQSMDRAFTAIARELTAFGILKAVKPPVKEQA